MGGWGGGGVATCLWSSTASATTRWLSGEAAKKDEKGKDGASDKKSEEKKPAEKKPANHIQWLYFNVLNFLIIILILN